MKKLTTIFILFIAAYCKAQTSAAVLSAMQHPAWSTEITTNLFPDLNPLNFFGDVVRINQLYVKSKDVGPQYIYINGKTGEKVKTLTVNKHALYCEDSINIYHTHHDSLFMLNQYTLKDSFLTNIDDYTISYLTKIDSTLFLQAIGDDDTLDCPIYRVSIKTGVATKIAGNVHGDIKMICKNVLIIHVTQYTFGIDLTTLKLLWKIDNTYHSINNTDTYSYGADSGSENLVFDWKKFKFKWEKDTTWHSGVTHRQIASATSQSLYPQYPATFNDSNAERINYEDNTTVDGDSVSFTKVVTYKNGDMKLFTVVMDLHTGKVLKETQDPTDYSGLPLPIGPIIAVDTVNAKGKKIKRYCLRDTFDSLSKTWRYDITNYFPDSAIGNPPMHNGYDEALTMAENSDGVRLFIAFNNYLWCFAAKTHQLLFTKHFKDIKYISSLLPVKGFLLLFDIGKQHVAIVNLQNPNDVVIGPVAYKFADTFNNNIYTITDKNRLEKIIIQ